MDSEEAAFSVRVNRSGEPVGELRVNIETRKLDVLDMVAISESKTSGKYVSRTDIVDRLITEFVDNKVHEATLIYKAVNSNPTVLE